LQGGSINSSTHSSGISNGELTLLDIIKALGEFLTSEEDRLRAKGELLNHLLV
jgi:DNA repair/transcription protein MET18/MMS19